MKKHSIKGHINKGEFKNKRLWLEEWYALFGQPC